MLILTLAIHSSFSEQIRDHEEYVPERESDDSKLLQTPVVQNSIPDQKTIVGKPFNLSLNNVFSDADGDFLTLSARLSTGDPLPSWMSLSFPSPSFLGSYNTPNVSYDVTVSGTTAFVADGTSGLQIINVSDPSNPTLLGSPHTQTSDY